MKLGTRQQSRNTASSQICTETHFSRIKHFEMLANSSLLHELTPYPFKVLSVDLKGTVTERAKERETELFQSLIHLVVGTKTRAGPLQIQEPRASSRPPTSGQEPLASPWLLAGS